MTIDELCALPVADLAARDSALFLWATFPQLPEALRLIKEWGFTYKSVAFVWLKKNKKADSWFYGLGFWTRGNAEICLLATRGHPKRQAANIHQFIISPIEAHSKKPDEAREKIVALMGDLPRVELFARQTPPGWDVWGNEVTSTLPDFGTKCPEVHKHAPGLWDKVSRSGRGWKGGSFVSYVNVPNDLSKIKTKMAFNLTKRQLVCFGSAAAVGIPSYLLARGSIGNTGAMFAMLVIMLPAFLLAMYEKDGLPFEKVVKNIIRARFTRPGIRPYQTENIYAPFTGRGAVRKEDAIADNKTKKRAKSRKG